MWPRTRRCPLVLPAIRLVVHPLNYNQLYNTVKRKTSSPAMLCYAMLWLSLVFFFVMVVFAVFNILTFEFFIIFIRRQDVSILHCLKGTGASEK